MRGLRRPRCRSSCSSRSCLRRGVAGPSRARGSSRGRRPRSRRRSSSCPPAPAGGRRRCWPVGLAVAATVRVGVTSTSSDNDPIVLLTYVAVALDRVSPLDPSVFDALASPGVSVEATVVPRLGAALATMDRPVVLVLDDLHLLENPACLDAIASLTRHVPEGRRSPCRREASRRSRWERCGRVASRWRSGRTTCAWTQAEARQLLSAAGVDLPDEQIAELTEHTEGWSARAVSRCAVDQGPRQSRPRARPRSPVATGSCPTTCGRSCSRTCLPDDFRFLTRTAVLERMSGPLCDAVLESSGSAAIAGVAGALQPVPGAAGPDGEWYRYHHLFQELLRAELERAEPELVPRLLARAADWCEANGQPESGHRVRAGGRRRRPRRAAGRQWRPPGLPERPGRDRRALARLARGAWGARAQRAGRRARRAARRAPGPAGAGGALGRRGRTRQLRRPPARRQPLDRLVAGPHACAALSQRGGEDARGCRACGADARAAGAGLRPTRCCCSGSRVCWPARSTRPTTCSPTSSRRASSWGRSRRWRWRSASAP